MQHRHGHPAELLEGVGFERRAVALPIVDARFARGLGVNGAMRRDNAEPEAQKWVVDAVQRTLGGSRAGAEWRLAAHQLHGRQRGERAREAGGRALEAAGDLAWAMCARANGVQQRPQGDGWRRFFQKQAIRFAVQRACRVQHQRIDSFRQVGTGLECALRQFPIVRQAAPNRVQRNEMPRIARAERFAKMAWPQRLEGERLDGATVERRTGIQRRAMHHVLARAADDSAGPRRLRVDPILQRADDGGIGDDQVGQFVQDERPAPAGGGRFAAETGEERAPVGIFHVGKARQALGDGRRQIAPLHAGRGLVGHRVQAAPTPRPLDEKTRLPHPATTPDDRERPRRESVVQTAQFRLPIQKVHARIMRRRRLSVHTLCFCT